MKKIYILASAIIATSFASFGQKNIQNVVSAKASRNDVGYTAKPAANDAEKVEGQLYWDDQFDTPANWVMSAGAGHTVGDWTVVSAIPASIASQQAAYGWPATFSGATGNFAFIDSDAAGNSGVQRAYFTFNQAIDLSAAGNAAILLKFAEYYRHFYDKNFVEVSNDGGVTWTQFAVNEVGVNVNCAPGEEEVLNITAAKGAGAWTNDVRLRFYYEGAWDWFWGIDNVRLVEAWDNDMKIVKTHQATDLATTLGLDYYHISNSQATTFPGLTFGANVINNGGLNQANVALRATATGGYDQTGAGVAINTTAADTLSIATPYIPTGVGTKTITLNTEIGTTDGDPTNNTKSFDVYVTNYEYSRDNNVQVSSIGQISSQTTEALSIGNVMEIFNNTVISGIKIRLATQNAAAVGSEFYGAIYRYDAGAGDYVYVNETSLGTVTGTAAAWVTLPIPGGVSVSAGDDLLVIAGHYGGTNPVRFGLAQGTFDQTVLGYTGAGDLFSLSSPSAVMIRLIDSPLAIDEVASTFGVSVFPNPATSEATVAVELNNESNVAVNVTDLAGKTVYSTALNGVNGTQKIAVNTAALTSGIYMVNVNVNGVVSTQKLVVKQ